jgi:hypothetical protein
MKRTRGKRLALRFFACALAGAFVSMLAACGADDTAYGTSAPDAGSDAHGGSDATTGSDAQSDGGPLTDGASDEGASRSDAEAGSDAGGTLVQKLVALTSHCTVASTAKYATDQGVTPTIDVCRLNGAFFWTADMDIDCDGQSTAECNATTDPAYQNQTSFTQSNGQPLSASVLPYVVVPLPSAKFSYVTAGIKPGAVVIVIYSGKMMYGVFGDEGPSTIIGEASYAMAKSLGIDPNPATGGVDTGVTYIVFTGAGAVASPIEDHQAAVTLGQGLASTLLQNN